MTSAEAERLLGQYGPNAVAEERARPWRALLLTFWAPVPWMLEAAVLLDLLLGKTLEAAIIAVLLLFNAALSFLHENRAQQALALLRERLSVQARVRRDGAWRILPAAQLVPGDVIHVRLGDLLPADVAFAEGHVLLDQSPLTGESVAVERGPGSAGYAGAIVRRGEATGRVTATGARSYFGKTAELVRTARTASHLEHIILRLVRSLVGLDLVLVVGVFAYAVLTHLALRDLLPFALVLLIASVPVALPATFTLATALGAVELARGRSLVTRLSAIEEAAAMDVLCVDKTGTITENRLTVVDQRPYGAWTAVDLLRFAALASDEATQDPIDLAILRAARDLQVSLIGAERIRSLPFDPSSKRSEAQVREGEQVWRMLKGAPTVVASVVTDSPPQLLQDVAQLSAAGSRVLAVAAGTGGTVHLVGLLGLHDPPRGDSAHLVRRLRDQGVRVVMVTGDGEATARAVAADVGVGPAALLRDGADAATLLQYDVFAGVFPEDKYHLVQALQGAGHVVGMTGDGVNDAPALKQAEVGIAVASATDVAKAAASLVLTTPGLDNVLAAVETSRRIYQRMVTYTLNTSVKKLELPIFLGLGLLLAGVYVTTPRLLVLLLFANDFGTMSITTDRVTATARPDRWSIRPLLLTALGLAVTLLLFNAAVFWSGGALFRFDLAQTQTLLWSWLVLSGQITVYLVRERRAFWRSRPSRWLLLSTVLDLALVGALATQGWLVAAIPLAALAALIGLSLLYALVGDLVKRRTLRATSAA